MRALANLTSKGEVGGVTQTTTSHSHRQRRVYRDPDNLELEKYVIRQTCVESARVAFVLTALIIVWFRAAVSIGRHKP